MLFNPDTNESLYLNRTGVEIWKACDGTRTELEIIQKVLASFSSVPVDANEDISTFIQEMVTAGVIGVLMNPVCEDSYVRM